MFVGVGETVPPHLAATWDPPQTVRTGLPILGKVRPAVREVPASAPKKTGEELAQLFPELFEKKPQ